MTEHKHWGSSGPDINEAAQERRKNAALRAENERLRGELGRSQANKLNADSLRIKLDRADTLNAELLAALRKCEQVFASGMQMRKLDQVERNALHAARAIIAKTEAR